MKKIAFGLMIVVVLAACEPYQGSQDGVNSIAEEVVNVTPEV